MTLGQDRAPDTAVPVDLDDIDFADIPTAPTRQPPEGQALNTPAVEWLHADRLREHLKEIQLPDTLRAQISFRHTSVADPQSGPHRIHYPPPWPGCCRPPGIGSARIWGEFSLSEWITLAPGAFGPGLDREWAATLDAVAAKLRTAGEGSRTMWALDLLHPGDWTRHSRTGLWVADLVQWGPAVSDTLAAEVDAVLGAPPSAGESFGRSQRANVSTTYHGVPCYETTWETGV